MLCSSALIAANKADSAIVGSCQLDIIPPHDSSLPQETPSGFVLWDQFGKDSFRPKNELRVSDHIKLHFERYIEARGIVVNREVEIRKGMGAEGCDFDFFCGP